MYTGHVRETEAPAPANWNAAATAKMSPEALGVAIADRQEVTCPPSEVAAGALIEAAGKGYSPGAQRSVSLAALLRQTHRQALAAL